MTHNEMEGLELLDTFEYSGDRHLIRMVAGKLADDVNPSERGAIRRMRVIVDTEKGKITIVYRPGDRDIWNDSLRKNVVKGLMYVLNYSPDEWEESFSTDFLMAGGVSEMMLADGAPYTDPLGRRVPPADEVWEQVCKLMPDHAPSDMDKASVRWLGYARLLVKGPLVVLDWIYDYHQGVAAEISHLLGSHEAVVHLGFRTIEDAVGQPLLDEVSCRFSAYDIPLLYECKIAWTQDECALYAPYYSIQIVQQYMSAIRSDLDMPVSLVPVPFVKVPPFIVAPFDRTTANLLVL